MHPDPVVLFFVLGLVAGVVRSDLKLPSALYETLSVFLLLAIGLKGGVELASQPLLTVLPQALGVVMMGLLLPLVAYPILRLRLSVPDAASLAAHYGSVSVVTYAVGCAYLARRQVPFESSTTLFLALLEVPALVVGVLLGRTMQRQAGGAPVQWRRLLHEVCLGKSMVLLLGGITIGFIAGPEGIRPVDRLYMDLFKGVLTLFLLEMGLVAAAHLGALRREGWFIVLVGIGFPLLFSAFGLGLGLLFHMSPGGVTLLAVMAASASYIAAPAAMRIALPQANVAVSLGAVLGVTLPFNLFLGIPLYYRIAAWLAG